MINPFDVKTALFAGHAQHVVLIHFPIALFISAVGFDFMARWTKSGALQEASYYNLLLAAMSTIPVLGTGILAWQFQLEGQEVKGILLLHTVFASISTLLIWLVWWVHFRTRRRHEVLPDYRVVIEVMGVAAVALTGHLGGFLSGVTVPARTSRNSSNELGIEPTRSSYHIERDSTPEAKCATRNKISSMRSCKTSTTMALTGAVS